MYAIKTQRCVLGFFSCNLISPMKRLHLYQVQMYMQAGKILKWKFKQWWSSHVYILVWAFVNSGKLLFYLCVYIQHKDFIKSSVYKVFCVVHGLVLKMYMYKFNCVNQCIANK